MPGHDHSIAGNMVVGDLNSHEALWLWNCPVTNEELDIWHHINEYVLFTFIFSLFFFFFFFFLQAPFHLVLIHFTCILELLTCMRLLRRAGFRTEISWEVELHLNCLMPPVWMGPDPLPGGST